MAEVILAGEPQIGEAVASRIRRGIQLYADRAEEIVYLGAGKYRVPSQSDPTGFGSYITDIEEETCICGDVKGRELGICKHRTAAMIAESKRAEYQVAEGRWHDCLGGREYHLYAYRLGERSEYIGSYNSRAEAYANKWAIEAGEEAA